MSQFSVTIIMGRQKLEVECTGTMTFGELRSNVESSAGTVEGGMRLLHKGKSFPDHVTLEYAKVGPGTKMMAMRTQKQRDDEKDKEKRGKLLKDARALDTMKDDMGKSSIDSGAASVAVSRNTIRGDATIEGMTSVLVIKGTAKYRVNTPLSERVYSLKEKVAAMEDIKSEARDMRLLFKGKVLQDAQTLDGQGVKDGSPVMLLFSARHHDAKDDLAEIGSIQDKISELERKARSVASKAKHRLLDDVALSLAKGELLETLNRLKDNLVSVRSEDDRRDGLEKRLAAMDDVIENL